MKKSLKRILFLTLFSLIGIASLTGQILAKESKKDFNLKDSWKDFNEWNLFNDVKFRKQSFFHSKVTDQSTGVLQHDEKEKLLSTTAHLSHGRLFWNTLIKCGKNSQKKNATLFLKIQKKSNKVNEENTEYSVFIDGKCGQKMFELLEPITLMQYDTEKYSSPATRHNPPFYEFTRMKVSIIQEVNEH